MCVSSALVGMSHGLKVFCVGFVFQGRFSINLYGTGLSLTESARWTSQGNYAVSDIKKSPVRLRIAWRMALGGVAVYRRSRAGVLSHSPNFCLFVFPKWQRENLGHKYGKGFRSG